MEVDMTNDFGFTLADEAEIKATERKIIEQKSKGETHAKTKAEGLLAMFMPLLDNLAEQPNKEYILWPNRAEKIAAFKKKITDYYNS